MNRNIADNAASKSLAVIREAMKNDPIFKDYTIVDAGGNFNYNSFTLKFTFVNTNAVVVNNMNTVVSGSVERGLALPGTKIKFRNKEYTVVKAARKFYHAVDENDKRWRVPFIGSTLVSSVNA